MQKVYVYVREDSFVSIESTFDGIDKDGEPYRSAVELYKVMSASHNDLDPSELVWTTEIYTPILRQAWWEFGRLIQQYGDRPEGAVREPREGDLPFTVSFEAWATVKAADKQEAWSILNDSIPDEFYQSLQAIGYEVGFEVKEPELDEEALEDEQD